MKELVMVFDTNGTSKMTISIDNPKEEIALSDVQAAAEKLIPILITSSGAEITALNKASIVTTQTEVRIIFWPITAERKHNYGSQENSL